MDNTTLNPGSGGDVSRSKDRSGVKTQVVARDLNPGGATEVLETPLHSRSETFLTSGGAGQNGTAQDISLQPRKYWALQVTQTGGVTAWQADLQISLDGVNFSTILTHASANGDVSGQTVVCPTSALGLYYRIRLVSITGGTNVAALAVGVN